MMRLTPRQRDLLQLLAEGLTLEEAGQRLYITENSARSHARRMLVGMGARNRAHAVALGIGAGFITAPT